MNGLNYSRRDFLRSAAIDGIDTPGALQLYDLQTDLSEQHNLAEKMPEVTARLYNQLKKWRKSVGAQEMTLNPNYETPN